MDFEWTEEEVAFRKELVTFIRENVRPDWTHHNREMVEPHDRDDVLKFCKAMGARGMLTMHWPKEYGGREASPWEQAIVSEEMRESAERYVLESFEVTAGSHTEPRAKVTVRTPAGESSVGESAGRRAGGRHLRRHPRRHPHRVGAPLLYGVGSDRGRGRAG